MGDFMNLKRTTLEVLLCAILLLCAACAPIRHGDKPFIETHITQYQVETTPSPDEVEKRTAEFLQNNGGCKFPCFWGLVPEKTNYSQLESFFNDFGRKVYLTKDETYTYESTTLLFEEVGRVYLMLSIQDDTLTDIEITLDSIWQPGVEYQDWSAYNLDQILRMYGPPTGVELFMEFVNDLALYDIRLTYADLNTTIEYGYVTGYATVIERHPSSSQVELCFGEEISDVWIKTGENLLNADVNLTPLSEATKLDETSFYELFTEDPFACILVDREAMGW